MKILALETATPSGGVAIVDSDSGLLASYQLNSRQTHSERLMVTIDEILKRLGLKITELAGIGISIGPGSFTGVRIGISVAKGLALAQRKPIVAVRTLEALAYRFFLPQRLICPLIDARRGEVYAAFFELSTPENYLRRLTEDFVELPQKLLERIKQRTIFSGTGALHYRDLIKTALGEEAEFPPLNRLLPSAEEVALLALQGLMRGEVADPFTLEPHYIRPADAEIKLSQRQKK